MSIKITCDKHGRVSVDACGESTLKAYGPIFKEFGMDKDDVIRTIKKIDNRFVDYMVFQHTKTCTPLTHDIDEDEDCLDLGTKTFRNNTSRTATSNVSHTVRRTNKVSGSWSTSDQVTSGFEIGLSIKASGAYNKSYSTTSGRNFEKSEETIVGSDCGMSVPIPPRSQVVASLRAVKRTISVKVTYLVEICGDVAGVYGTDRQPQTLKISEVLKAAGKNNMRKVTETINVNCYTNAKITLDDYYDSD